MSDQDTTTKLYASDACVAPVNNVELFSDGVKLCFPVKDNNGNSLFRIGRLARNSVEIGVETAVYEDMTYPKRVTVDVDACGSVLQKNIFFNIVDDSAEAHTHLNVEPVEDEPLLVKSGNDARRGVPKREVIKPRAQTITKPSRHNK